MDTGSIASIIPYHLLFPSKNLRLLPSSVNVTAANGTPIKVYGELTADIGLRTIRRSYRWNFVVCDVKHALLGYDFLTHFNLIVDCKQHRLIDPATEVNTRIRRCEEEVSPLRINEVSTYPDFIQKLLIKYPSVIAPYNVYADKPKDTRVYHIIE